MRKSLRGERNWRETFEKRKECAVVSTRLKKGNEEWAERGGKKAT